MIDIIGTTIGVYIGLTIILAGGAAFLTGQALANTWQPLAKGVPFALLLAAGNRFLIYGLFNGVMLTWTGFLIDFAVMLVIIIFAFRLTKARKMVSQYPWLYERTGPFSWRERKTHA
ncbi:MAG: hypothetical protein H6842_13555 [Rhodospirillaceae bacterium]|nr:hypothetical protein [Rhodospirillaceae bacterium]